MRMNKYSQSEGRKQTKNKELSKVWEWINTANQRAENKQKIRNYPKYDNEYSQSEGRKQTKE